MNKPKKNGSTNIAPPGHDSTSLKRNFQQYFNHTLGRDSRLHNSPHYEFIALAMALRDRLLTGANNTCYSYEEQDSRRVCYLSMEYLLGRSLRNAALNLNLTDPMADALEQLGLNEENILEQENDGLGRVKPRQDRIPYLSTMVECNAIIGGTAELPKEGNAYWSL